MTTTNFLMNNIIVSPNNVDDILGTGKVHPLFLVDNRTAAVVTLLPEHFLAAKAGELNIQSSTLLVDYDVGPDTEQNAINLCNLLGLFNNNDSVLLKIYPYLITNQNSRLINSDGTTNYVYFRNIQNGANTSGITMINAGVQNGYPCGGEVIINAFRTVNLSGETVLRFELLQISGFN